MRLRRPAPIAEHHVTDAFSCGEPTLDVWLRDMALYKQQYTRTFVIADAEFNVVGYHSLCAAMIHRNDVSRSVKGGKAPVDIPVALLARLAVDRNHHGAGLGAALLHNALESAVSASGTVAFRAVMIDAISDAAATFYQRYGFRPSKISPTKLLLSMSDVLAALEEAVKPD